MKVIIFFGIFNLLVCIESFPNKQINDRIFRLDMNEVKDTELNELRMKSDGMNKRENVVHKHRVRKQVSWDEELDDIHNETKSSTTTENPTTLMSTFETTQSVKSKVKLNIPNKDEFVYNKKKSEDIRTYVEIALLFVFALIIAVIAIAVRKLVHWYYKKKLNSTSSLYRKYTYSKKRRRPKPKTGRLASSPLMVELEMKSSKNNYKTKDKKDLMAKHKKNIQNKSTDSPTDHNKADQLKESKKPKPPNKVSNNNNNTKISNKNETNAKPNVDSNNKKNKVIKANNNNNSKINKVLKSGPKK